MSSTNKTANLELNQWVGTDPVLMADFNADNQKIDAALGGVGHVIAGTYTGNGAASQVIQLGARPKAVLIMHYGWLTRESSNIFGGLAVEGFSNRCATLLDNGFAVHIDTTTDAYARINTNMNGTVYPYLALY